MKLQGWSYSAVGSLLDGCGWQFYLERFAGQRVPHDHPRAAVGTAFHAAVEVHERARQRWHYTGGLQGRRDGVSREFMHAIAADSLESSAVQWMDHDYALALTEAHNAVTHWWDAELIGPRKNGAGGSLRDRVMAWRPVAVEERFRIWLNTARPVRGAADCIYWTGTRLVVVDLKQARHFRNYPLSGDKNRLQATVYAVAAVLAPNLPAFRSDGWPAVEFHISRVETGKNARFEAARVVAVTIGDADVNLFNQRLGLADALVARGEFDKNPDWFLCAGEWCPFHPDSSAPGARGLCNPHAPAEFPVVVVGEPLPMVG